MNRFALVVIVSITFAMVQGMSSQSLPSQAWGPSANGLRIGISAVSSPVPSTGVQFMIEL
jgi:hypothetical protein